MPVITQTSIRRLHVFSNLTSVWNWMLLSLGVTNFEQATALRHHAGRVSLCVDVWMCGGVMLLNSASVVGRLQAPLGWA